MGILQSLIIVCILSLISSSSDTLAQQPYEGVAINNACANTDNSTSILGYSCNGVNPTCQSYLIFRSQTPYYTVSSIAALFGSDPSQLAQINSVSQTWSFQTNQEVIIPVNCSCSGPYYQANTSFNEQFGVFNVAYNTYQGLSTCQPIQNQNSISIFPTNDDQTITVPLRCACPTKNQSDSGIKYLLTFPIQQGDSISSVSAQFGAKTMETLAANELPNTNNPTPTLLPLTTLLVPLRNPPTGSQLISPPTSSSSPSSQCKIWVYVVIAAASFISFNSMRM
ncbi:lysM domain receptor-like kinase 4 [Macadamia integrifolia]|uniref:lysM domain receptor-like kinase 4 n=1 Tax=Macadamia integrifolia TaxID=60698 RepID=UPI001C4F9723|nr:lysM domain receptor-like kinase 4 [Macadamia integrifolia]